MGLKPFDSWNRLRELAGPLEERMIYSVEYTLERNGIDRWEQLCQTDHEDVAMDALEKLCPKSSVAQVVHRDGKILYKKPWGEVELEKVNYDQKGMLIE